MLTQLIQLLFRTHDNEQTITLYKQRQMSSSFMTESNSQGCRAINDLLVYFLSYGKTI